MQVNLTDSSDNIHSTSSNSRQHTLTLGSLWNTMRTRTPQQGRIQDFSEGGAPYEKWGGGGGGGGQFASGPICEKWGGGGGGGGGSPLQVRYTKSGGAIRFRSDTKSGGAVHFRSDIRKVGGGAVHFMSDIQKVGGGGGGGGGGPIRFRYDTKSGGGGAIRF